MDMRYAQYLLGAAVVAACGSETAPTDEIDPPPTEWLVVADTVSLFSVSEYPKLVTISTEARDRSDAATLRLYCLFVYDQEGRDPPSRHVELDISPFAFEQGQMLLIVAAWTPELATDFDFMGGWRPVVSGVGVAMIPPYVPEFWTTARTKSVVRLGLLNSSYSHDFDIQRLGTALDEIDALCHG